MARILYSGANFIDITVPLSSMRKLRTVLSSGPLQETPVAPPDLERKDGMKIKYAQFNYICSIFLLFRLEIELITGAKKHREEEVI